MLILFHIFKAFFHSNELRQKIDEAKEEISMLKEKLKELELGKHQGMTASTVLGSEDEDSLESGSQMTFQSAYSHESNYSGFSNCRSTAARLELDRAMREIKGLRLELVYAKSKSRSNGNKISSDASSCFHSTVSNFSNGESNSVVGSLMGEDHDTTAVQEALHAEQERIQKEAMYLKINIKKEKTKHEKEKDKLLREIERLQASNIFNSKEITRLMDENKKRDEMIHNLKSMSARSSVVLLT